MIASRLLSARDTPYADRTHAFVSRRKAPEPHRISSGNVPTVQPRTANGPFRVNVNPYPLITTARVTAPFHSHPLFSALFPGSQRSSGQILLFLRGPKQKVWPCVHHLIFQSCFWCHFILLLFYFYLFLSYPPVLVCSWLPSPGPADRVAQIDFPRHGLGLAMFTPYLPFRFAILSLIFGVDVHSSYLFCGPSSLHSPFLFSPRRDLPPWGIPCLCFILPVFFDRWKASDNRMEACFD